MNELKTIQQLDTLLTLLRDTSSSTEKKALLTRHFKSMPELADYFHVSLNPLTQYYLTKEKVGTPSGLVIRTQLLPLLCELHTRTLTGHAARDAFRGYLSTLPNDLHDTVLNVLNKDLKCHVGIKLFNDSIKGMDLNPVPEFNVALGNQWKGEEVWKEPGWFASRKLDGIRCIAILQKGSVQLFSRQGILFETLKPLEEVLSKPTFITGDPTIVLDGELCLINPDDSDDFQGIMKQIRRKDHQITNVRYHVFDYIPYNEFLQGKGTIPIEQRWNRMCSFIAEVRSPMVVPVGQVPIESSRRFERMLERSKEQGWEGLILRKNTPYEGKRTKNLYKVKLMQDLEAEVVGTTNGTFNTIKNGKDVVLDTMKAALIQYKGNTVHVGGGWSLEQRERYFSHPEEIIGKIITVQYFEETINQDGSFSLRFPVMKIIHGGQRTT